MKSISLAKITRSEITNAVVRKRLFDHFDDKAGRSVIWVTGPGGAGKTTLVSTWLSERKRPCLWYEVDHGDGDPATFFHFISLAARKAAPRTRRPLPAFTPEYLVQLPQFSRRYFEDLGTRLKTPSTIVFDNYQYCPHSSSVHEIIRTGVESLPEGISVIIISRREPHEQFTRMRGAQSIRKIGWEDIRFTIDETRVLARLSGMKRVDVSSLKELHALAEGWAAGLVLLLERMKRTDPPLPSAPGSEKHLFDYFAADLFNNIDPELQDFLLRTAYLPYLTPDLTRRLTSLPHADRYLQQLHREHFFISRHAHHESHYQYHQMFRHFLQHRAVEMYSAGQLVAIEEKAAGLLEQDGKLAEAVSLRLASRNWTEAARLVCAAASELVSQGRSETVRTWINSLPDQLVDRRPSLLYWRAVSLMSVDPRKSRTDFERAFDVFREQGDRSGLFLAWTGAADVGIHELEYSRTLDWLDTLSFVLADDPSYPSQDLEVRVALSRFNAMALCHPDHPDMVNIRERALHLFRTEPISDSGLYLITGVFLTVNLLWQGDLTRAGIVNALLKKAARSHGFSGLGLITIKATEALHGFFANDLDGCIGAVREALAESERSGVRIWDTHNLGHGLAAALAKGDKNLVDEFSNRMAQGLELSRRADQGYYHFLHCWKSMQESDHSAAQRHYEQGIDHLTNSCFFAGAAGMTLGMAMLCSASGKHQEAEHYYIKGQDLAERMNSDYLKMMALMGKADDHFRRADDRRGVDCLGEALRIGCMRSIENLYFWQKDVMSRLCVKALEHGIETDYVVNLIQKRDLVPDIPPMHLETWPWQLRIFTLGRFEIERGGKRLAFPGKLQKKPLELLKALIAFDGANIAEDRLVDALWPDAEGDAGLQSLTMTIHRLRKLLGNDDAIRVHDGLVSLDPRRVWVDAWAFLQAVCRTQDAELDQDCVLERTEKAIIFYKGIFLPSDATAVWSLSARERLKTRFNRLISTTGRAMAAAGDIERAVDLFEQGIGKDELAEEFYQDLMECLIRMGRRSEAAARYHQCRKLLLARLGIGPSKRTEELFQKIVMNP